MLYVKNYKKRIKIKNPNTAKKSQNTSKTHLKKLIK